MSKISVMDIVFAGFGVVYRLLYAMMGRTLQKFITNSHFVGNNIISIALAISITCLCVGKKLENFSSDMKANLPIWSVMGCFTLFVRF